MILTTLLNILDIFLVAILLYATYKLMKNSGAMNIFLGVLLFLGIWLLVTYVLKLRLFGSILDKIVNVGAIALIVLFQNEIRHFLVMLGSRKQWHQFERFFSNDKKEQISQTFISQLVLACRHMAEEQVGALIVLERQHSLSEYASTGERIDGVLSSRLLENIFFKNSPLHDGAVIVVNGKVEAAACILPVSSSTDIPASYGLRHRSALGIAQATDAIAIVVSEETGQIAMASHGQLKGNLNSQDLEHILIDEYINGYGFHSTKSVTRINGARRKPRTRKNKGNNQ